MATQDNRSAGKYNRRVELLKPTTVRKGFNEKNLEYVVAYGNYPARVIKQPSGEGENLSGNMVQGKVQITWDIRWIPKLGINTTWRIRDIFDDIIYTIVAPPTEIGFREGIMILTELVQ